MEAEAPESAKKAANGRFWELDALRGISIISMVLIHTVYDLMYFNFIKGEIGSEPWRTLAFFTASTFLVLVGISFTISYSRRIDKNGGFWKVYHHFIKRGSFILSGGILITIITSIIIPNGFIFFGILHLIGISIIIAPFFYNFGRKNIYFGAAFILIGLFLMGVSGPYFLLPFGIGHPGFFSYDYEPIFPWFGIVLMGMYLGNLFYPRGGRSFRMDAKPGKIGNLLGFLGRHSLLIYFLHQPIIIIIIKILF